MLTLDNELIILERYRLTPTELFVLRAILIAKDDENFSYLKRYLQIPNKESLIETLISLQEKGVILKSYKIPSPGNKFMVEDVEINKNFVKNFYRCSFDIGNELWNTYPMFIKINGCQTPARGIARKFDSPEQFFEAYGKTIRWSPDLHNHIIDLLIWAKENTTYINFSISTFVIERKWEELEALRNGDINFETVKML